MPNSTVAAAAVRNRLFSTNVPSRLTGAKAAPERMAGARTANRTKAAPAASPRMASNIIPRWGSTAKACTLVSTPERTRNAPSMEKVKARMARKTVQPASAPRRSVTMAECSSAAPASHGMKLAFSTGSQNHQPPQPSS